MPRFFRIRRVKNTTATHCNPVVLETSIILSKFERHLMLRLSHARFTSVETRFLFNDSEKKYANIMNLPPVDFFLITRVTEKGSY